MCASFAYPCCHCTPMNHRIQRAGTRLLIGRANPIRPPVLQRLVFVLLWGSRPFPGVRRYDSSANETAQVGIRVSLIALHGLRHRWLLSKARTDKACPGKYKMQKRRSCPITKTSYSASTLLDSMALRKATQDWETLIPHRNEADSVHPRCELARSRSPRHTFSSTRLDFR